MTRITVVVNCNTTASVTETAAARARPAVDPGTTVVAVTPSWGCRMVEGWYDSFISAAAVLHTLEGLPADIDGVGMAGFGEHGRECARELLDIPVVDIAEAAAHLAMRLGRRYGVITTVRRAAGLGRRRRGSIGALVLNNGGHRSNGAPHDRARSRGVADQPDLQDLAPADHPRPLPAGLPAGGGCPGV